MEISPRVSRSAATTVMLTILILVAGHAASFEVGLERERHACLDHGGMSCEQELEDFLLSAEVIEIEDVGDGITRPRRVVLAKHGQQRRAIFKTVDITSTETHYTNRLESVFTDRYVYEVAAYRIDRLLGIGLVPVTVVREIGGERGSLQYWVERTIKMQQAMDQNLQVGDLRLLLQRLMLMYILDGVIYNIDRNFTNVLTRPDADDFFLIDHSRSFRTCKRLPTLKEERNIPVPERVARGLRDLDLETLESELASLLSRRQIRAVDARRKLMLEELGKRGVLPASG